MLRNHVSRFDRWRRGVAVSGGYALIVLVSVVVVEISTRQPGSQGLEGILVFFVTSPTSFLLMMLPLPGHPLVFFTVFPAAGLFQAWVLWRVARGRRREREEAGPV